MLHVCLSGFELFSLGAPGRSSSYKLIKDTTVGSCSFLKQPQLFPFTVFTLFVSRAQ